jgi:hypothetical protein
MFLRRSGGTELTHFLDSVGEETKVLTALTQQYFSEVLVTDR